MLASIYYYSFVVLGLGLGVNSYCIGQTLHITGSKTTVNKVEKKRS